MLALVPNLAHVSSYTAFAYKRYILYEKCVSQLNVTDFESGNVDVLVLTCVAVIVMPLMWTEAQRIRKHNLGPQSHVYCSQISGRIIRELKVNFLSVIRVCNI